MRALRAAEPETAHQRWTLLAVVSAAQFLIILDLWVVTIAVPTLQRDFASASLSEIAWILDGYTIVLAALLLPVGRAADSIGRRECFLAGLVVFGVASLGCALAPDLLALIVFRALQAAGAAVLMPTSLGLALQVFPSYQRGTAIGIWAGVGAVAAGSGPVLGGLLVQWSWRWIFLINVPVILAALAAGVAILPRRPSGRDSQRVGLGIDRVGTGLVLGAVAMVCAALTEAPRWPASRTCSVLVAGVVLGVAFVAHIRGHPDPLVAPQLFSVRAFRAGAAGLLAYYTGFASMLLGTTLLLTAQWGFSALHAAACIAPGPITAGIVSPFSGRLSARFGVRRTVVAGAACFAAAGAWPLASTGNSPTYPAVVLPSMLLWGVANALIQPSLFGCADAAPRAELASGSAVLATARQLGSALGVAIFVAVLDGRTAGLAGFDRAWIIVLISAVLTGVAGLGSRRAAGRREPGAEPGMTDVTTEVFDDGRTDVPAGAAQPVDRVIVVGAGIAGLTVANALAHGGVDCVVLEARDRIGGRLHTVDLAGSPVDLGGSWIHTPVGNPLRALAQHLGVPCRSANPLAELAGFDRGEGRRLSAAEVQASVSMQFEDFPGAIGRLRAKLGPQASAADGIEAFVAGAGLAPGAARRARQALRALIEAESADRTERQSLRWMWNEIEYGGDYFGDVPVGGYRRLVQGLATGVELRLGVQVAEIVHSAGGVRVRSKDGTSEEGSHVVVTVPLGVLKRGRLRFSPALPPDRLAAIARLGFGRYEKVAVRFDKPCWRAAGLPPCDDLPPRPAGPGDVGDRAGRVRRQPGAGLSHLPQRDRSCSSTRPPTAAQWVLDLLAEATGSSCSTPTAVAVTPGRTIPTAAAPTPTYRQEHTPPMPTCSASRSTAACCLPASTPKAHGWLTPTAQ